MRAAVMFLALMSSAALTEAQQLSPELARTARLHYEAGVELMTSESWEKAAEEFKAAAAIDKLMAMAYYNLGQCRMAQRRFVEAIAAYEACREAFEQLGTLSRKERDERDRARRDEIHELQDSLIRIKTLKNVSEQDAVRIEDRLRTLESMQNKDLGDENKIPAGVYLALGSAYFRQDKLADAERQYREAIRVDRKLGAAHNNLAVIYLLTGRVDEAEAAMKLAEKNGFRVNPRFKDDLKAAKQQ